MEKIPFSFEAVLWVLLVESGLLGLMTGFQVHLIGTQGFLCVYS